VLVALGAALLALLLAEGIVRVSGAGWRHLGRMMHHATSETEVTVPDPDPRLMYRLRPGGRGSYSLEHGPFSVSVNALGFRGRQRSAAKPAGVFRIICFGGSNVYGHGVDDDRTWPARLEQRLNAAAPGRFEVWNGGVGAYVGRQMAVAAERAMTRFSPDLVIFAMTNVWPRHFPAGADVGGYFARDPTLWGEVLPDQMLARDGTPGWRTWPLQHLGLYRLGAAALLLAQRSGGSYRQREVFPEDIRLTRAFLARYSGTRKVAVFLCPAAIEARLRPYHHGLDLPLFVLRAGARPAAYRQTHPPPVVLGWYAERLAAWLRERGLVPPG